MSARWRGSINGRKNAINKNWIRKKKQNSPRHPVWENRIVGYTEKPANSFLANALNFRRHPNAQREALRGSLSTVGWVAGVVENVRTGNLIDGHARIEEALSQGEETSVPVIQIDVSLEEEKLILATLDPLSALATIDSDALIDLLSGVETNNEGLDNFLSQLQAESELELSASQAGASAGESHSGLGAKSPEVKAVIAVSELSIVEAALAATQNPNRGKALVQICQAYLDAERQLNI